MSAIEPTRPIALIADDDDVMRLMLSAALEQAGLDVVAVTDGPSALEAGTHTAFALVLLDVEMPGLDGYAVCRSLRQSALGHSMPIVMITGHDDWRSVKRSFEAGATDFIPKPVNWPLMPHRLRYLLRNTEILRRLEVREAENRALLAAIPDRIHLLNRHGQVLRVLSDSDSVDPNRPETELTVLDSLVPAMEVSAAREALRLSVSDGQPRSHEFEMTSADGTTRHYQMRYFRAQEGEVMAMRQDVTLRHRQEQRIRELAYFDPLTKLPNRQLFIERATAVMRRGDGNDHGIAVLYLDLDQFKRVNDTFGHGVGDEVLQAVAARLRVCADEADATVELARFSGDDFVMYVHHARARERAIELATACCAALASALRVREQDVFMEPSVGIAAYPEHGHDVATLLKNADTAMYQAKAARSGGFALYSDSMSARAREWLALDTHLRQAVRKEMFELYFQPKIRLTDGRVVGAEALLRWFHPDLGEVSPVRFIPLAEESGLILSMGAWVIRAACRQLSLWAERGIATSVAINLSGKELLYGNPAELVREATKEAGIDPAWLEIEITESVFIRDSERVQDGLAQLRGLGCRIALDDFGTGYSSLAYLKRFPPDTLKVDRMFVRNVHQDRGDAAIFDAILSLAANLDVTVVAEGVEKQVQHDWLRARGCHVAQGFLLGRPMPAHQLETEFLSRALVSHRRQVVGGD